MNTKLYDWKDIANAQFSKALSLALVMTLFAIMVTPKIESKKQKFTSTQMELVDIPMEEREKIQPPETEVQIDIPLVISDELGSSDDVDITKYEQALSQIGDIYSTSSSTTKTDEKPVNFVPYDDAPVMIGNLSPEYPSFAKRAGIQGSVVLEVEVYKDGTIGEIRVRRSLQPGPGGLDEAAKAAVRKVKFQPGKSSGQAVDTMVIIPIEFKLN